jgi:hypothetical protein
MPKEIPIQAINISSRFQQLMGDLQSLITWDDQEIVA